MALSEGHREAWGAFTPGVATVHKVLQGKQLGDLLICRSPLFRLTKTHMDGMLE